MKTLALILLVLASSARAQTRTDELHLAFAEHNGHLTLSLPGFTVRELSAKPNGNEFGIRAQKEDLSFLGFLFLWPEKPNLTAESCRDEMLKVDGTPASAIQGRSQMTTTRGTHLALALLIPPQGNQSSIRAFAASGSLCGDLLFTLHVPVTKAAIDAPAIKALLDTADFEPGAKPTFRDAYFYATVEWDHHALRGAASSYAAALKLVDTSDDPLKWRRVTTDQLSMSLGMSGDLAASRAVNMEAIQRDPEYPLYYYNLACADAEAGDVRQARLHLEQAFQRKKNTLPGETLPKPSEDDSIMKLRSDSAFWTFVQSLQP